MTDETGQEASDAIAEALSDIPTEELRLALVLNGGVSLAVWMGGVAHEIDRLTRSLPGTTSNAAPYGPILAAACATATVDIISGTSAGGINGAALALAQANKRASLLALRTLWQEQGRMEELLRRPFQGAPTSLLRGDDYFLPELHRAMRMLATPYEARAEAPEGTRPYTPIDLTLTTTLLKGAQLVTIDDFGHEIPQRVHTGSFLFSNVNVGGGKPTAAADPFSEENIEATARAMALAARCTASFPFAFEPSFVPVGEPHSDDELRSDMWSYASWNPDRRKPAPGPAGATEKHSRFAMDGGVLANTPLTPTLDAIDRRQADGPVRRSLLLVFPHAPAAGKVDPDKSGDPPGALGSLGKALGALMAQGSRSFVEEVDEHNRRAGEWRGGRDQILEGFGRGEGVRSIYEMLDAAWSHYRHIRIRIAARGLANKVEPRKQWSYDRIRQAAEGAQQAWATSGVLPYVPARFDWSDGEWQRDVLSPEARWQWGDSPALGIAESAAAVFRAALSVVPADLEEKLAEARKKVGVRIGEIHEARRKLDVIWTENAYLDGLVPDRDYWRARIVAYGCAMNPMPEAEAIAELERLLPPGDRDLRSQAITAISERGGRSGSEVWSAVSGILKELVDNRSALMAIARSTAGGNTISGVRRWCHFLFTGELGAEPDDAEQRLLLRLLALDAATRMLSEGSSSGANLPVRLAELSLRIEHPWAQFSRTPDDKAAGLELSRFGGFLKRSWRMNDWTWGRLDAITMLCQIVLDPQRLRRLAAIVPLQEGTPRDPVAMADALMRTLRAGLYGTVTSDGLLAPVSAMERAARDELTKALSAEGADLRHLPALAQWVAFPLQAEAIIEELPELVSAIKLDTEDGAGRPTRGTRFVESRSELFTAIAGLGHPPPDRVTTPERLTKGSEALLAFDQAGIGREQLSGETGSNALIRTASNAAGVMATVIDTEANRMPAIKPVTSSVRGALLLPYWLVTGLSGGGSIARFLATVGLIAGALFLALSLFGVLGGFAAAAGLAGAAAVLAAFGYSAMKTGSLLHACALLAPVGPLIAFAVASGDGSEAATRVVLVLAVVLGLFVLANIPWPMQSPMTWWSKSPSARKVRHRTPRVLGLLLVAGGAAVVGYVVGRWAADKLDDTWVDDRKVLLALAAAATVVIVFIGARLALAHGRLLRLWRPAGTQLPSYQAAGAASGEFLELRVSDPAGVAATWAPVYGAAYFVAAWLLGCLAAFAGDRDWDAWEVGSVVWLAGLGVLLCLAAPAAVTRPARGRVFALLRRTWLRREETAGQPADPGAPSPDQREQLLLHALLRYDSTFGYLVEPATTATTEEFRSHESALRSTTALVLTRAGGHLLAQLEKPPEATATAAAAAVGPRNP